MQTAPLAPKSFLLVLWILAISSSLSATDNDAEAMLIREARASA
jgi:hypothetical protein